MALIAGDRALLGVRFQIPLSPNPKMTCPAPSRECCETERSWVCRQRLSKEVFTRWCRPKRSPPRKTKDQGNGGVANDRSSSQASRNELRWGDVNAASRPWSLARLIRTVLTTDSVSVEIEQQERSRIGPLPRRSTSAWLPPSSSGGPPHASHRSLHGTGGSETWT
jgi:hypothetical protein